MTASTLRYNARAHADRRSTFRSGDSAMVEMKTCFSHEYKSDTRYVIEARALDEVLSGEQNVMHRG